MEVKDPNAPKKPVNAYVMFFQHKRHSVQENYFKVGINRLLRHEQIPPFCYFVHC